MIEELQNYIEKFDEQTKQRFCILYGILGECTSRTIKEILWAKLPSFYVESNFVRIIPFKDHINIEAKAIIFHLHELREYTVTPKKMLQIFHHQQIPDGLLKTIFKESLDSRAGINKI